MYKKQNRKKQTEKKETAAFEVKQSSWEADAQKVSKEEQKTGMHGVYIHAWCMLLNPGHQFKMLYPFSPCLFKKITSVQDFKNVKGPLQ